MVLDNVYLVESMSRWLRKLVGQENDLLFHFLRVALVCIILAALAVLAFGIGTALWKAVTFIIAAIVAAATGHFFASAAFVPVRFC